MASLQLSVFDIRPFLLKLGAYVQDLTLILSKMSTTPFLSTVVQCFLFDRAVHTSKEASSAAPQQALPSSLAGQNSGQLQGELPAVGQSRAAAALSDIAATPAGAPEAGPDHQEDSSAEHEPPADLTGAPLTTSDKVLGILICVHKNRYMHQAMHCSTASGGTYHQWTRVELVAAGTAPESAPAESEDKGRVPDGSSGGGQREDGPDRTPMAGGPLVCPTVQCRPELQLSCSLLRRLCQRQ